MRVVSVLALLAVLAAAAVFGSGSAASATPAGNLPTLGCVVELGTGGSFVYEALRRPRDCASQSAANYQKNDMQLYSYSENELGEMRWSSWTAKTAHGKGLLEGVMGGPVPIEVWLSRPVVGCPPEVVAPQTERTFSRMRIKTGVGRDGITARIVLPVGPCRAKAVA